jgi:hypothetical protein
MMYSLTRSPVQTYDHDCIHPIALRAAGQDMGGGGCSTVSTGMYWYLAYIDTGISKLTRHSELFSLR